MKIPGPVRILAINALLLAFLYLVEKDLAYRNSYAESLNFAPSSSYSVLTRLFTLAGRGTTLVSPLTFDWIQLLILALVGVDVGYAARVIRRLRSGSFLRNRAPESQLSGAP